jgi:hypothetical protein
MDRFIAYVKQAEQWGRVGCFGPGSGRNEMVADGGTILSSRFRISTGLRGRRLIAATGEITSSPGETKRPMSGTVWSCDRFVPVQAQFTV